MKRCQCVDFARENHTPFSTDPGRLRIRKCPYRWILYVDERYLSQIVWHATRPALERASYTSLTQYGGDGEECGRRVASSLANWFYEMFYKDENRRARAIYLFAGQQRAVFKYCASE